jgi:outer membrane cobalamin receptor
MAACATTAPPSTQRVNVTATRIAQPVASDGRLPQTASPTQVVSQDDIESTGRDHLASALRELVPALH